jgi:acyl dehydratase
MYGSPLAVGTTVSFSKTVSESDIYLFAGISGDFAPNHVDEVFMAKTPYKKRIAHGALLVAYASRCSTMILDKAEKPEDGAVAVSLGYDRIRFLKPVFIGDTVTLSYAIKAADAAKRRTSAEIEIKNQNGELVAVMEHILKWVT